MVGFYEYGHEHPISIKSGEFLLGDYWLLDKDFALWSYLRSGFKPLGAFNLFLAATSVNFLAKKWQATEFVRQSVS
jgi:hypothetical protein